MRQADMPAGWLDRLECARSTSTPLRTHLELSIPSVEQDEHRVQGSNILHILRLSQ
jgi:hypothetical protein